MKLELISVMKTYIRCPYCSENSGFEIKPFMNKNNFYLGPIICKECSKQFAPTIIEPDNVEVV